MTDLTCYTTAHLDCFVMALERDGEREGGREREGARERERERERGGKNELGGTKESDVLFVGIGSHIAQQSGRST